MNAILGGTITYGRTIKPADYESKKAEVTLTFGLDENMSTEAADDFISLVGAKAMRHCARMLGLNEAPVEVVPEPISEAPKRARKLKEHADIPMVESEKAEIPFGGDQSRVAEVTHPASTGDFGVQTAEAGQTSQGGAGQNAMIDASRSEPQDFVAAAEPAAVKIPDIDLMTALNRKATELGSDASAIIGKFLKDWVPSGATARQVPQEKRADFLEKVNALKAN